MKGFTLVELVIVIAIVIVLSVVSVPIYRSYVDKAKIAEGYALLGTVLTAQKAYYSEYGNFLSWDHGAGYTCNNVILGIDARGNKYFTWFRSGHGGTGYKTSMYAAVLKPQDLRINGKSWLGLIYNITEQATFYESAGTGDWEF